MERKRNQKGFTLIELAVAIAVIAILISGVVVGTRFLSSGEYYGNTTFTWLNGCIYGSWNK